MDAISAQPCPWLDSVSPVWQNTATPYGPVFILSTGLAAAFGSQIVVLAIFRVYDVLGLILLAVVLPVLARRRDVPVDRALWLVLCCPQVGVHLVGGGGDRRRARRDARAVLRVRAVISSDDAGGVSLPGELAYLSATGVVGGVLLDNDPARRTVLFLPASRDGQVVGEHLDGRRGGGCTAGYVDPEVEVPTFDTFSLCRIQMPVGGGWYWLDGPG